MCRRTCCNLRRRKRVISNCLKKIEPALGCNIPRIKRRMVLVPLPLWPMMTRRSSGATESEQPSSTFFSVASLPPSFSLTSFGNLKCEISTRHAGLSETERQKIVRTLEAFDLPTRLPASFPRGKIVEAIQFDKKFERREVRFVVTPAIGSACVVTDVTMEDIEAALEKLYRAPR